MVREAIWDAAIDLFVNKGFNETTIDDIAKATGISRRSFFRYFASKDDLIAEDMVLYAKTLGAAIATIPAACSPLQLMQEVLLQVANRAAAGARTRKSMQIAATNPAAKEAHLSRLSQVQDSVAEAFTKRQTKHPKDESTPRVLAGATMCLFDVTFRSWFESGSHDICVTAEQVMAKLVRLCCEKSPECKQEQKKAAVLT